MNALKKTLSANGIIAVITLGVVALLILGNFPHNSIQYSLPPVDPGFTVLTMGSSYDVSTNKSLRTVFEIPIDQVAKQPVWDPTTQELPVPLSALEKIAFKNSLGPDATAWAMWKVTNVTFQRVGWTGPAEEKAREDRWFCELTLTNQDPAHYIYKTACLLLDGTYVPPKPG